MPRAVFGRHALSRLISAVQASATEIMDIPKIIVSPVDTDFTMSSMDTDMTISPTSPSRASEPEPMEILDDKIVIPPVDSGMIPSTTAPINSTTTSDLESRPKTISRTSSNASRSTITKSDSSSTNSDNGTIRIKTKGIWLSSGFEYTNHLFNLRIDPVRWEEFSNDVIQATQLTSNDKAAVVATITGFSLVGLVGTGLIVGDRVQRKKKLKRILENRRDGGLLSQVVESWNENYFRQFGVKAWIEISEAALRNQAKKSGEQAPGFVRRERSFVERTPLVVFNGESRRRRREERKYMAVLSPLEQSVEIDGGIVAAAEADSTPPEVVAELPPSDLIELAADLPSETSSDADSLTGPPPYTETSHLFSVVEVKSP